MNTPVIQCLALLVLLASSSKIFGNQVGLVVPQELAEVEGVVPSAVPPSFPDGDRIQFVLPASAFDSLPASHRTLTGLRLRPDSERTTTIEQQDDFLIRLSTTDRGLDQLSLDFDENFGLDETTVFDGLISLSSDLGGPPEGPRRFDLEVSFQTPFNFDPTDGNLLIDIVERGPRVGIALDLHDLYGLNGLFAASDSATAADARLPGPVVEFLFVPEPGAIALAVIGLCAAALCRK